MVFADFKSTKTVKPRISKYAKTMKSKIFKYKIHGFHFHFCQQIGIKLLKRSWNFPHAWIVVYWGCSIVNFITFAAALYNLLDKHPDIKCSHREVYYFNKYLHRGLDWYLKQMPESLPHQVICEKVNQDTKLFFSFLFFEILIGLSFDLTWWKA